MNNIESLESKFRFVHAASRRARQLQTGAPALIPGPARKPTRMAIEEVMSGVVEFVSCEVPPPEK